jgi:hypothetical protein
MAKSPDKDGKVNVPFKVPQACDVLAQQHHFFQLHTSDLPTNYLTIACDKCGHYLKIPR